MLGWKNIVTEDYVGESHGYACNQTAVGTTNGAGPVNTQMFVISADGVVCHALPGFWHPDDLARELRFGASLVGLWNDPTLPDAHKRAIFRLAQIDELYRQPSATYLRSDWQGFDAKNEIKRLEAGIARDTVEYTLTGLVQTDRKGRRVMKRINALVHQRLALRPFVAFDRFDVEAFCDYGREYYDNNKKVDGKGITFMTPERVAKHEARQAKIAARDAKKRAREERARRRQEERRREREREAGRAKKKATLSVD